MYLSVMRYSACLGTWPDICSCPDLCPGCMVDRSKAACKSQEAGIYGPKRVSDVPTHTTCLEREEIHEYSPPETYSHDPSCLPGAVNSLPLNINNAQVTLGAGGRPVPER